MDLLPHLPTLLRPILPILTTLGALTATSATLRLLTHIHTYFLRAPGLSRYTRPHAYALITGASDGIGRGYARALAAHGLNLILHGRNPAKLAAVRDSLLSSHPTLKIHLLVIDAADAELQSALDSQLPPLLSSLDGPLTILINNAGGAGAQHRPYAPLEELGSAEVAAMLDLNTRFPVQLTRLAMPSLIAAQPSLLLNISSFASVQPSPWLPVYAATKGFGEKWTVSMGRTLKAQGHYGVEALVFVVGHVCGTTHNGGARRWGMPTGDEIARDSLRRVGTGREVVIPWWPHAVQMWVMELLPRAVQLRFMTGAINRLKEEDEKGRKDQ